MLLALDVVFTVVFATAFAGRSRQDYSFPIIGNLVNRYAAENTDICTVFKGT